MATMEYPLVSHSRNKLPRLSVINVVVVVAKFISIVDVILLVIAISTNHWGYTRITFEKHDLSRLDEPVNFGLWKWCLRDVCGPISHVQGINKTVFKIYGRSETLPNDLLTLITFGTIFRISRGLGLVSVCLIVLAILFLLLAVFKKSPRCTTVTAGVLLFFAAIATGSLAGVFVVAKVLEKSQSTGYSVVLACVSSSLSFIAAIVSYIGAGVEKKQLPGVVIEMR